MSLKNKVAIVSGASSGIGAAIAVKLTEEGAKVVLVGRNEDKLKNVSNNCKKRGLKPLIVVADVTQKEDVKRIITETLKYFEKIHIIVNNAGISGDSRSILSDDAMDDFEKVMNTNLRSAVLLTHLAAKHLITTKGNIVNISSIAGQIVMSKNAFAYCASKAGLDHFSRCIALELAAHGVRVNTVSPGPVKTDILENKGMDNETSNHVWDMLKGITALNRIGDPEEIADLVAFLVSDKARSITGANIVSDNGAIFNGHIDFSKE